MKKVKMVSKIRYARQGCKCQICQTWLEKGVRKANQFLCCNEDSDNLTPCQKKHRQIKLANETATSNRDRAKTLVCDQCEKTIPRIDQHQKRCVSGVKGVLSTCQKKAKNRTCAKHYKEKKDGQAKRSCLRCRKTFLSTGKYNKICEKCDDINSKISVSSHSVCFDRFS